MAKVLTAYASQANMIADTYRAAFAQSKVGELSVEMTAPEDSTKGGLLALQHVTLKPPVGMALVVGSLHAGEKRAELRSYEHVARMHSERFKRPLPCDEPTYRAFVDRSKGVLGALGMTLVVSDPVATTAPVPEAVVDDEPTPPASRPLVAVGMVAGGLLVAALAVWLMLRP